MSEQDLGKTKSIIRGCNNVTKEENFIRFSPAWVILHIKDASNYKMGLIDRIRNGVEKADWKKLIQLDLLKRNLNIYYQPLLIVCKRKLFIASKCQKEYMK